MNALASWDKDPAAELDYSIDWTAWLDGDTIATSEWTVPGGLAKESDQETTQVTTVWLSGGGPPGRHYLVKNRITTAAGRTDERTIEIVMAER